MINNGWALATYLTAVVSAGCHRGDVPPPGYQGIVEYDDRVVSSEVSGRVLRVAVQRGDLVAADAELAQVDDTLERLECGDVGPTWTQPVPIWR
ncbi:MAG: hypothetical protein ACREJ3_16075 [Polyangiaceae bacterium]